VTHYFEAENNHHKKFVWLMGGYFLCRNDNTATINVLKDIATISDSNTVISSPLP